MSLIRIVTYADGLKQLAKFALNRELVPFFGAGFSSGCQAAAGVVPDARSALMGMSKLVCASKDCPFSEEDLVDMDFVEVSNLFFEYTMREDRANYFEQYYTNVDLYQPQIRFLTEINWPYAYTINVDDGIERNSDFTVVLPYHRVRRPKTSKKLLYKLHGDASYESQYIDDDQNNIIFSQQQYMQAITSENNTDIYDALLSDYSQKHLLFIGCSLQAEQDLQYVYEKSKVFQKDTYRIVLRKNEPSLKEQQNLKHHGINEIILVDDYEMFYMDFLATYKELELLARNKIYEHINPTISIFSDREHSLNLLASSSIFHSERNEFYKGALHIKRNIISSIIEELESQSFVLLKGRRFSGKTYCLCSLAEYYKTRDVFYFPSASYADEDVIQNIFNSVQNSILLFDSNSVTPDVYALIAHYAISLKQKNNYMVIAANTNDNYLISELQCNVIDLYSTFVGDEISLSKKALDSFGLVRRKGNQTNIDYLYTLKAKQNIKIPIVFDFSIQFTQNEKSVLIALCALDKLYNSDLVALNFTERELRTLCKKLDPLIEVVPVSRDEVTRHSASKLVHNSKIAIVELLKQFSTEEIATSIQKLVSHFKPDYSRRRLYIEIILFDTINQIFSGHECAQSLIYTIYERIQPLLKDDLHYWLQRAKSIYRTTNSNKLLDDAYTYAKKAYLDGSFSLSAKAALTIALISCAIAEQKSFEDSIGYHEEAVLYAYESVFSEYFHLYPSYLNTELPIGKNTHSERRIVDACKRVQKHSQNEDFISKSSEILGRFDELRAAQKSSIKQGVHRHKNSKYKGKVRIENG